MNIFFLGKGEEGEEDCCLSERHVTTNRASQGLACLHLDLVVSLLKIQCVMSLL